MGHKIENRGGFIILNWEDGFSVAESEKLQKLLEDQAGAVNATGMILAVSDGGQLSPHFLRAITPFAIRMRDWKKKIYFCGGDLKDVTFLKTNGVDGLIVPAKSVEEVLGTTAPRVDVNFINPFIDATLNTLKVQCSTEAKPGKTFLKNDANTSSTEIAAVIGLTSRFFNGSVAVCFPKEVFLAIMGRMLGEKYVDITKDLEDGAGELLNIIFGHAKTVLNDKGFGFDKAIPTIIRGERLKVMHLTSTPTIILPFDSEVGSFFIEIGIEQAVKG